MPVPSYELSRLDTNTFEHLVNSLALRVLGAGHTGFGPGPDGGRDGFFEGAAPYPSASENWSGTWYIQSKFLAPHLSKDPQRWLVERVEEELLAFERAGSKRKWPDIWIIATNVEPSGAADTGSFDRTRELVRKARPQLAKRFHIWSGRKILDLLAIYPEIAEYYCEFVTSGQILTKLYEQTLDSQAQVKEIIRCLVVTQFNEQQYTKLEQAGSTTDNRPGIQRLFADIPFACKANQVAGMAATTLAQALAQAQKIEPIACSSEDWQRWQRHPSRARTWFVKGGPGQGKSTLTQFISQIQRAAIILQESGPLVLPTQRTLAEDIRAVAIKKKLWPLAPRIPLIVDLKEFAFWFGQRGSRLTDRMVAYFSETLTNQIGELVQTGTLRRIFGSSRWLFVFDGLDEVPSDVKDAVANEVTHFINDVLVGYGSDAAIICTSRPQGYSGQFSEIDAAVVELVSLSRNQALACAEPLLALDRSEGEYKTYVKILGDALQSEAIAEIMTTPLQAHIMAVIVRDGGKPPERKWQLYNAFYEIIKKREANRNLPDRKLALLLREGDRLLKALHNRLGFELHARAETSKGAITSLDRKELFAIVTEVVSQLQDTDIEETVSTLMRATTERLVLVSTPEAGELVRFDIRPLQEFFAGEFIYQSGEPDSFVDRVRTIAGDSHWREVIHFLLSALIENTRKGELAAAVTVLTQLDDGGDRRIRALNRRLARGGIIASRLLQEGVLEQDKRVREQFRSCILPLSGCVDANRYLSMTKSPHSVQWLTDVLVSVLLEQAEPENIGALICLTKILPESDERSQFLKSTLLNASRGYQRAFLEQFGDAAREATAPQAFPRWLRESAFKLLLDDNWYDLGYTAVSSAIRVVASGPDSKSIALDIGVDPVVTRQIDGLLPSSIWNSDETRSAEYTELRYGLLEAQYFKPKDILNWKAWSPATWKALSTSTGILKASYCALCLVRSPNDETLADLRVALGGDLRNCRMLPETVCAFLDLQEAELNLQDRRASKLVRKIKPGYFVELILKGGADRESVEWSSVVRREPWLTLHLLTQGAHKAFKDPKLQRLLLDHLPSEILLAHAAKWGTLFGAPEPLGKGLRELALTSAKRPVRPEPFFDRLDYFEVRLPDEAEMLPHLVAALVHSFSPRNSPFPRELRHASFGDIGSAVRKICHSGAPLKEILQNTSFPRRVRAAAGVFYGFHSHGLSLQNEAESLVGLYDPAEASWFLPAIALLLSEAFATDQRFPSEVIGALLESANSDFPARFAVNPILASWREVSRAPVTKAAEPLLWN